MAVSWCVIWKETVSGVLTLRVPESEAPCYTGAHRWTVLIRDSEMPPIVLDLRTLRSNPRRVPDPSNGEDA